MQHHLSPQEAEHYENIELRAQEVNGRECLVRDDIDWDQRDAYGQTNRERAEQGLAPLAPDGRPYELHHVQQRPDGMLAELTRDEHRSAGVDRILHDPTKTSEINRAEFDQIRADHWCARAAEVQT
ncbi:HNH/ENDO VII family nuclease [Azotobacter sp. CWF10]